MSRLLIVSVEPPSLDGGGYAIREYHLTRFLTDHFETHLMIPGRLQDPELRSRLARVIEVPGTPPAQGSPVATRRRAEALWRVLVQRRPEEVQDTAALRRRFATAMAGEEPFDVVALEHTGLGPLTSSIHGTRSVLTLHQLASRRMQHQLDLAPGPRQRWLIRREHALASAYERWTLDTFDAVVVPSPEDADELAGRAVVVPNGVDLEHFAVTPAPSNMTVVFCASLNTAANVDAAAWFVEEIMPRVRIEVPEVNLLLVGRRPTATVRRLASVTRVELHADVPDVLPYLQAARVAVVPLRIGSGTRLKAIEAMAAGRPVIGTSIGLEGLGAADGVDALVADDLESFATSLVAVLGNDKLAERLAKGGRRLAERFSWDAIGRDFARVLEPGADYHLRDMRVERSK
jgi:glycosyltransferase involved in cell wall biosynthesis